MERRRVVRDAERSVIGWRLEIERELVARGIASPVVIIVVELARDVLVTVVGNDRAVDLMRVVVVVRREMKIRNDLDTQQPQDDCRGRGGAAMSCEMTFPHRGTDAPSLRGSSHVGPGDGVRGNHGGNAS